MLEKINGFTEAEVKELIAFLKEGKAKGRTLSSLFSLYGKKYGRAAGSVRNYYYKLLKTEEAPVQELLKETTLHAEQIIPFTPAEENEMLALILQEKAKGYSIRRAIMNVCDGDNKKMLRYQNKYRNLLKYNPQKIADMANQFGLGWEVDKNTTKKYARKESNGESYIAYSKIAEGFKIENERLRHTLLHLERENALLRKKSRVEHAMKLAEMHAAK